MAGKKDAVTRAWMRLSFIWALYYFAAFTLGNIPEFMQKTIWTGAGMVGLFTVPVFWRHFRPREIPREGVLLILFTLWAVAGMFMVTDFVMFHLFLKLVIELTVVVIGVSVIVGRSGGMAWFYLAYLGVAVFRVVTGGDVISLERIADTRVVERIAGANAVGYYCALGIAGLLALLKEVKSLWLRLPLVAGGAIALYGVVLSASRGAFVALIAISILWPLLCMVGSARYKLNALMVAMLMIFISMLVAQVIIQDTYLGVRFTEASQLEDGSSQTRLELFIRGMQVFAENPVFGVGLGQFGVVSRTGHYAHNEFAEIIATTGLPGFFLYFPIYLMAWRRLSGSLRFLQDPLIRYRVNIARMILLVLLISGFLSRPNFISQDTMFMLGIVVGVSYWAERSLRLAQQDAAPAGWTRSATAWDAPVPAPGFGVSPAQPNFFARLPEAPVT